MSIKKNILIFPAGSEIGLEIHASLKFNKHFHLVGASSISSHAQCVFRSGEAFLPMVSATNFVDELNALVAAEKIDFIFPAHDEVILFLARNEKLINATLLCPLVDVCEITQYKSNTYKFFDGETFIPATYETIEEIGEYPIFRKPSRGQNSIGAVRLDSKSQLDGISNPFEGFVVSEYLPGREYTVDCFSTRKGELKFQQARERIRTKYGISMNSTTIDVDNDAIRTIAERIVAKLNIYGAWFFQVKEDASGVPKLMEIAPRLAGTSVCARFSGVNTAALTIYDAMGIEVGALDNEIDVEIERALANRVIPRAEFDNLVVDLDDTLLSPELGVNLCVLNLIYQYKEREKEVYLITRHLREVRSTLAQHHICETLFSKIVHLTAEEPKSEYFPPDGATLFIDDAFSERVEVSSNLSNVVAIDVDAVDGFLDYSRL